MKMTMKTTLTVLLIMELLGLSSAFIKQHFFVNQRMNWTSARMYCRTFYHDLSSFINRSEEQQFLEDAVDQSSDAWVGLYRESEVWKWSEGEIATQINWDSQKDDDINSNKCALLQKNQNTLIKARCTNMQTFFCMTRVVLVLQNESWEGALEYCRTHHSDLGSLSSTYRMDSALETVKHTETQYVWTALRFLAGEWLWVTGDVLSHTAWPPAGQPRCPDTNLRCGALAKQTGLWTNRDCEEKLNFVCQ